MLGEDPKENLSKLGGGGVKKAYLKTRKTTVRGNSVTISGGGNKTPPKLDSYRSTEDQRVCAGCFTIARGKVRKEEHRPWRRKVGSGQKKTKPGRRKPKSWGKKGGEKG